jgi:hypothetical protein
VSDVPQKILFLVGADSFLRVAITLANQATDFGYEARFVLLAKYCQKQIVSEIQQKYPIDLVDDIETIDAKLWLESNAIYLAVSGPEMDRFNKLFRKIVGAEAKARPLLVGGYVGLVYKLYYEGFVHRCNLDMYILNSASDQKVFEKLCYLYQVSPENLVVCGLPFFDRHLITRKVGKNNIGTILFAGQPDTPSPREAKELLKEVIRFCLARPEIQFIIKPRIRPKDSSHTFHKTTFHYETILNKLLEGNLQVPNLKVSYEDLGTLLDQSDGCLTISSTVAFEAYFRNLKVGILCEGGVTSSKGNFYFLNSGAVTSLRHLAVDRWPKLIDSWFTEHVEYGDNIRCFYETLTEKLCQHRLAPLPLRSYRLARGDELNMFQRILRKLPWINS